MEKSKSKITLYGGEKVGNRQFTFSHAEALLKVSKKWSLPTGSPYEFSKENGLNKRRSKGSVSTTEGETANNEGN